MATRAQEIAKTIMEQLGGNKFKVMTGSKDFCCGERENGDPYLQMNLTRNMSKANRLSITLKWDDTYTMEFTKITPYKFYPDTGKERQDSFKIIETIDGAYAEDLQTNFTSVTGLNTRLF